MYDSSDPRASLAAAKPTPAPAAAKPFDSASCVHFKDGPPQEEDALSRRWYARGNNFVVCYVEARPGARITRHAQADEYMVVSPLQDMALHIESEHGAEDIPGYSVAIVPAGRSTIEARAEGHFFVIYSSRNEDVASQAVNAQAYAAPRHHVAPLVPWPDAVGGPRIRHYSIDVPDQPGRFGRLWRCSTLMVNVFPEKEPRDIEKVSPHHHDDFEQGSLLVSGTMSHHLRWPWTTNMRHWLPDQHLDCGSPSLTVIPPPSIHTSNGTGGPRMLVDVFSPPRLDFSLKPGWVLNADEYPMPAGQEGKA